MHTILPQYIYPIRLGESGTHLSGKLPLSNFTRLHPLLTHKEGEIAIDLQFDRDAEQFLYLKGTIEACLPLECQRCLKKMDYPLKLQISLSPVLTDKEAGKLPDRYEPLLLQEDRILLSEVIEEELLLAIPIVPKHEEADCAKSI